jgi:hypothetical protein
MTSLCDVCREYYAGRNTVGSYLVARNVFSLVMLLGPLLTAVIIYWMTGALNNIIYIYVYINIFMLLKAMHMRTSTTNRPA